MYWEYWAAFLKTKTTHISTNCTILFSEYLQREETKRDKKRRRATRQEEKGKQEKKRIWHEKRGEKSWEEMRMRRDRKQDKKQWDEIRRDETNQEKKKILKIGKID